MNLSINEVYSASWKLFKNQITKLFLISFFVVFVSAALAIFQDFVFSTENIDFSSLLFSIFQYILGTILTLGLTHVCLEAAKGKEIDFPDLFAKKNGILILHYFFGQVIMGIAIIFGILFFVIPGIYLMLRLQFFSLALIEQEDPDFMEALKKSWEITKGHVLNLFGLGFVILITLLLSILVFGIGLLFAIPFVTVAMAYCYILLMKDKTEEGNIETDIP